ncbi:DMT family transporter [Mycolicibacterium sp. CH28]|uniref:DMT family transporter n=1 Tax=Mycolicibacterium sp. CH28 TaxID=2512237 RepID=UPI0010818A38|nr:DMT family transporter [Mycolicibacterium sp. CH28]TGD84705.1 DMT family transporter [Mycolicibacterium sp. CH28]
MATHRAVDLALLGVAVVWGSSYLAAKDVVTADTVVAFLVIRFGIAAAGLALILAPRLGSLTRAELGLGAVFGVILSAIFGLETFGVSMTSASNAGLIIALTIVMTPLLERWVRHTHLPPTFYGAAVIAVAGVGLLTQNGATTGPRLGDLLILLAAVARAVHVTVIAHLSARRTVDSARVTLVQLATCLTVFVTLSLVTGRGVVDVATDLPLRGWLITGYLALVCTVFAFVIQMWAVRRTSSSRVSLLLGTEPLWAAGFGVMIAGDPVTVVGAAGAGLILLGTNWGRVIDSDRRNQPRSEENEIGLTGPYRPRRDHGCR